MKRRLKTFLVLVAIFLLPMLWLLVSHILAKHALEQYKAQLRAACEKLTVDEMLPPRVQLEKNGAKLFDQAYPYLQLKGALNSNAPPPMRAAAPGKAMIGWQQPLIISAYDSSLITNTWEDIERELKQLAPGLELLHQAATFSELNFVADYREISSSNLSSLAKLKQAGLLLSAATVFDLNRGDTTAAVTNLHTLLAFVDKQEDERLVISQLVRIAMAAVASSPQWEVLQETNLTDPELALLQHDWESMEFIRSMEKTLEMDRALSLAEIDQLRTSNSPSASVSLGVLSASGSSSSRGLLDFIDDIGRAASRKTSDTLWRTCWSYDDERRKLQGLQVGIETARQIETNGSFSSALAEQDRKINALGLNIRTNDWLRTHLDNMSEYFGSPVSTARAINRILRIEATRRVTITAIALKRYRLRHGIWPANLNALSPEFLSQIPRDPTDGQPMHYQPNPDGTFTLYSMTWVWPQPATPEETQQFYNKLK